MILLLLSIFINMEGEVFTLDEYRIGKGRYVVADEFTEKFEFSSHWNEDKRILNIQKEKVISLIPDNPFIKVERDVYQLPRPPVMDGSKLLIPVSTLELILSNLLNKQVTYKENEIEIGVGVNIYDIKWEVESAVTRITIECSSVLKHFFSKNDGGWVLTLFDPLYREEVLDLKPRGMVEEIKKETGEGFLKLRFKTKNNLPMDVIRKGGEIKLEIRQFEKREISTIVVDAGHGGRDPGACYHGHEEKDIVLKIAKKLSSKLTESGFNVIMTRTDDTFISLKDRTLIADKARADFFVSIHCNAAPNKRTMNGAETYFLSAATSDWAKSVAATENSSIKFEIEEDSGLSELDYILNDLAQTQYLEESREAAIHIQENLIYECDLNNRGVKQANFYVLRLNYMPAVLVEVAFMSHQEDIKRLEQDVFLDKAAEAIYKGIKQYAREHS